MRFLSIASTTLALSALLTLAGCSSYQFESNADPENFKRYFGERNIDVYMNDETPDRAFKLLSIVTGESCQAAKNQPPANASDAKQALRSEAYRFKADAVVYTQCFDLSSRSDNYCYSKMACFGQAVGWQN
ncbi:Rcs stress response system protein RcsF [Idiomarina xiamenensis]|uniref:Lipoprotein n=1 Tax=Idiomarina xiamenensis 10-D-4 TaxID=740709 RepID=K2KQZ9_9GAMM|nr:Rcs stress response system protein RcsF [Idiomarina xiamenensis]EKE84894.1 hypothetical protein A10D4_04760 [Idiomarina xiamenensis 10-D-4]